MKKQKIFEEVKTFEDFKGCIKSNIECLSVNYMNEESLEKALTGFNMMSNDSQQKIIDFVHFVDNYLRQPAAADGNLFHKMPMILAASIYFEYYPETVKDLSMDELAILSQISIMRDIDFYEHSAEYFGRSILTSVANKVEDSHSRLGMMIIAEKRLLNGQTPQEISEYLSKTDLAQLKEETDIYCRKTLNEALGEHIQI